MILFASHPGLTFDTHFYNRVNYSVFPSGQVFFVSVLKSIEKRVLTIVNGITLLPIVNDNFHYFKCFSTFLVPLFLSLVGCFNTFSDPGFLSTQDES